MFGDWMAPLSRKAIPLSCAYLLEEHRDTACVVRWADSIRRQCHTLSTSYFPIQLQNCPRFPWANLISMYPPWHTSYFITEMESTWFASKWVWSIKHDLLKVCCSKQCQDSLEFFCRSFSRYTWIPRTWKKLQLMYSLQAGRKDELGKLRKWE